MTSSQSGSHRLDALFRGYPRHLRVEHLAEVLGVGTPTAYRWLQVGLVPGYKVGRVWLILRDEVRDFLVAGRNFPPADADNEGS